MKNESRLLTAAQSILKNNLNIINNEAGLFHVHERRSPDLACYE